MKNIITTVLLVFLSLTVSAQYVQKSWKGSRVAYFGDSITDPNNKAAKKKYWSYLQEWFNIEPFVPAKSGRQWNDIPRQTDLLTEKWGNKVDAILIFMGTNDFFGCVPLGEWYDEKVDSVVTAHGGHVKKAELRRHRTLNTNIKTLRGSINVAMAKLKKEYPTKQIVVLTPIHRAGFFPNEKNWQPAEDWSNGLGLYISDYVDVVKEIANVWAVPVIDLNSLCGLYPMEENHGQYFKDSKNDRLHPNDLGHKRIAETLVLQLNTLPCIF